MTQITMSKQQDRFLSRVSDVLVYIVVLNLFVEFNDAIIIDSFWISILTAVLLKELFDVVIGIEHGAGEFFERWGNTLGKVLGVTGKPLVLFTSKLIILEIVNFVFGDHVELGHFIDVLLLIITMMAARALLGLVYDRLGDR
jgi:hypothetical protein